MYIYMFHTFSCVIEHNKQKCFYHFAKKKINQNAILNTLNKHSNNNGHKYHLHLIYRDLVFRIYFIHWNKMI